MKMIVCDIGNMECMIDRCEKCPGFATLQTFVEEKFQEYDMTASVEDFTELLVYQVDNLSSDSFIAKSQPQYLKARKENINEATCIVLLDFAENYHYVVQDEVQGYHWNKEHSTSCGHIPQGGAK